MLHLALELTDLLLAQLVITRRELESSQYGPFSSDLSVDNENRSDTHSNNNIDNSLQTENLHLASDNVPRRNVDRERFPRNRGEMPSAEESLSVGKRRYRDTVQQLKRLIRHRRGTQNGNNASENQTSNPTTARSNDNIDDNDNNYDDNAQNEDNRQSTSENALSAEVQSIVERIQSSSSIDNDDRGDIRTGIENRTIDVANESRNLNESYRRSYRNATVSEPTVRRNESRGPQETDSNTHSSESWRNYISYTSSGDEQNSRSSHQRTRWTRQYARGACSSLLERPLHRYGNSDSNNNRRFPHSREGASLRREFNVPELQVNNVPVNDLDNLSSNPRRRQNTPPTPPHTPPPFLINNFLYNATNRNNNRTNESTDQPGPSWAGQSNNNRTSV